MKIDILTLFPEMIEQTLAFSIPGRAQKAKQLDLGARSWREWGVDKHGNVDDSPYGGGPGMVLRVDVAHAALEAVDPVHKAYRIMLSPDGEIFTQKLAKKLSLKQQIVLLCGRYEGFDARIDRYIDQKISVGQYVVSGGELPAMIIVDTISRLLPGVLGNEESLAFETFESELTDYPNYTRPEVYDNQKVPDILLSGHHAEIEAWRKQKQKQV